MNFLFVCCVCKYKYNMIRITKSRKTVKMVITFKDIYEELNAKGHNPKLHVLYDESSKTVKYYIQSEKNKYPTF